MTRIVVIWIIACTLVTNQFLWAASSYTQEGSEGSSAQILVSQLDKVEELVEGLRKNLDRSQFDLNALLTRLEYEPNLIIEFVRNEVAWESYDGLLRGAQGTLHSRAGNALDQAVLLATLLKDAGYDARIARAELSKQQVEALVREVVIRAPQPSPIGDVDGFETLINNYATSSDNVAPARFSSLLESAKEKSGDGKTGQSNMEAQVKQRTAFIVAKLDEAGVRVGGSKPLDEIHRSAQQYFWVQFRDGVSGSWQSSHPAFSSVPEDVQNLQATEIITDSIPESLQHRIRIQAFIERKFGDDLKTIALMDPWERPAANLAGTDITFVNLPDSVLGASFDKQDEGIDEILSKTRMFYPTFMGVTLSNAFDLLGNVVPVDEASSHMAGVFQEVNRATGEAAGALSALGTNRSKENAKPQLSAMWLEISSISPSGSSDVERRYLLRRPEPGNVDSQLEQDSIGKILQLMEFQTMAVSVGRIPLAYLTDRQLEHFIARFQGAKRLAPLLEPDGGVSDETTIQTLINETWPRPSRSALLQEYYRWQSAAMDQGESFIRYRNGPALFILHEGFKGAGPFVMKRAFDIVFNPHAAIGLGPGQQPGIPSKLQTIRSGVWQTLVEQAVLDVAGGNTENVNNVMRNMDSARTASIPIETLVSSDLPRLSEMDWPEPTRLAIEKNLIAGHAVIVPHQLPPNQSEVGWWRVNLDSGETLGMLGDGRGSTGTEYGTVKTIARVVVSLLVSGVFAYELYHCIHEHASPICCLIAIGIMGDISLPALEAFLLMGPASLGALLAVLLIAVLEAAVHLMVGSAVQESLCGD